MKKIAVLGSGTIGGMLAAYLKKGGEDVTLIPAFRRESAARIRQEGITIDGPYGSFHVFPDCCFLGDLPSDTMFDYIFLGLKANNLTEAAEKIEPHLRKDGCVITLQNGINEEFLTPILGQNRVIAGISFAGGQQTDLTHYRDHDGAYMIGELDGAITPRLKEIKAILEHARPTDMTSEIRKHQWTKLSTVALHVPCCTVSGDGMLEVFDNPNVKKLFPYLAKEVFAVAEADGCPDITIQGKTKEQWERPAADTPAEHPPFPPHSPDAYTKDIQKGLSLEIDYINGTIIRLGKQHHIPTPANSAIVAAIRDIEAGRATAGTALMEKILTTLESC